MRIHRAPQKTWVRACLLVPTAIIAIYGLYAVWAILIEDGHRTLGDAVGDLDFACVVVVFLLGPASVTQALGAPTPPRNDGPPRGGIVPFPARTPGDAGVLDVAEDRSDRAARVGPRRFIGPVRLGRRYERTRRPETGVSHV
jgi:hypothetical protein